MEKEEGDCCWGGVKGVLCWSGRVQWRQMGAEVRRESPFSLVGWALRESPAWLASCFNSNFLHYKRRSWMSSTAALALLSSSSSSYYSSTLRSSFF